MPHPAAFFFVVDAPHSTAFPVAGAPHPTAFPGASAPIPTAFPTAGVPLPALSRRIQAFAGPCYSPLPNPRSVSPSSSSHSALPPLGSTSSHLTCHSLTTSSRPPAPTLNAMPHRRSQGAAACLHASLPHPAGAVWVDHHASDLLHTKLRSGITGLGSGHPGRVTPPHLAAVRHHQTGTPCMPLSSASACSSPEMGVQLGCTAHAAQIACVCSSLADHSWTPVAKDANGGSQHNLSFGRPQE